MMLNVIAAIWSGHSQLHDGFTAKLFYNFNHLSNAGGAYRVALGHHTTVDINSVPVPTKLYATGHSLRRKSSNCLRNW